MTTLTDWYDPKVDGQPVRVGEYERKYGEEDETIFKDWWNGKYWSYMKGKSPLTIQFVPWRGLTEPNEEKPNGKE